MSGKETIAHGHLDIPPEIETYKLLDESSREDYPVFISARRALRFLNDETTHTLARISANKNLRAMTAAGRARQARLETIQADNLLEATKNAAESDELAKQSFAAAAGIEAERRPDPQ